MAQDYPPVEAVADWRQRLDRVPVRAYWPTDGEPLIGFPVYPGGTSVWRWLPYGVALEHGVVRRVEEK